MILAVVGCAHSHTPGYIHELKAHKDVQVKYVWDSRRPAGKEVGRPSWAAGRARRGRRWADPQVKVAVVCAQTNLHQRLVLAGAKAGKHLFVEKPWASPLPSAAAWPRPSSRPGVLFTTGYGMRTTPEHLFLKQQVTRARWARSPASVDRPATAARWATFSTATYAGWPTPTSPAAAPSATWATHSLDILMWLIGDVESVTADIKVVTGRYGPCDESGEALSDSRAVSRARWRPAGSTSPIR